MRDYTNRRVTPPKRVSSPTRGIPPLSKQALGPRSAKVETAKDYSYYPEVNKLKPKGSISFIFLPPVFSLSFIMLAAGLEILTDTDIFELCFILLPLFIYAKH